MVVSSSSSSSRGTFYDWWCTTGLTLGVGMILGLALPHLVVGGQRRRGSTWLQQRPSQPSKRSSRGARNDTNGGEEPQEAKHDDTPVDGATTAQAVRAGLANNNSQEAVRIERSILEALVTDIFVAVGCPPEGARLTARVLAYADARGIPSHGTNRADTYVNEIRAGLVDPTAVPVVEQCQGACAVICGNNGLGAVTSQLAMETALALAQAHGVAVVTCHSSNHYGAAGYWAQLALDQGYIGLSLTNTSPFAVPTRSRVRGLGTNPFCFFAPGTSPPASFQLDMATTTVPVGKIEVLDRIGKPVPPGWGVDRHGEDCTNAAEICQHGGLYPLGGTENTAGYKGYGLGVVVEILSSVLSGASVGPDVSPWTVTRDGPLNYGHCFIVIDPQRFTPGFEDRLTQYMDRMRNLPGQNVLVAGDPEKAFEQDAATHGVLLHKSVATALKALAQKCGVTNLPPALANLDERQSRASLYE